MLLHHPELQDTALRAFFLPPHAHRIKPHCNRSWIWRHISLEFHGKNDNIQDVLSMNTVGKGQASRSRVRLSRVRKELRIE
jgi:hypothetical protein